MSREKIAEMESDLKKVIAANLKRLMKERNYSQKMVSELSGIPKSTISDYINENTLANPGQIQKLADVFKVSKSEIDPSFKPSNIVREESAVYEVINNDFSNITYIPIVGTIAAGCPITAVENIEGYLPMLSTFLNKHKTYFYLNIKGNSMNLEFPDGSYVLVEETVDVENGQIAAVRVNGYEATVKKISKSGNIITLIPLSTDSSYQPQTYDLTKDDIKIIGRVIQAVKNY